MTQKLTYSAARSILKDNLIRLTQSEGEYRVNFYGATEETAYYTNCLEDAYKTGLFMASHRLIA